MTQLWVDHVEVRNRLSSVVVWPNSRYGLNFNPRTTGMTTVLIWSFIIVCICDAESTLKSLEHVKEWITSVWTWMYVMTKNVWIIFIAILYFKYGNLKLGKAGDEPEYSTVTWFVMLFACGTGNEMFYYGVLEPMYHYALSAKEDDPNRASHLIPNERAQWSIGMAFFHEGFHGWVVYCVVGLSVAFAGHRLGLPFTMRSCLYALVGDKVFGFFGDMIDTLSAVCTMLGLCVTLGMGVVDVNAGFARLSGCAAYITKDSCPKEECQWEDLGMCKSACEYIFKKAQCTGDCVWLESDEIVEGANHCIAKPGSDNVVGFGFSHRNQIIIIWIITLIATLSVVSGMRKGIRVLSEVCFLAGNFLWFYIFFAGDSWYFLDVFTQCIGFYFKELIGAGFHTDAFARHTAPAEPDERQGASVEWMDGWTIFFWGWWVAWAPFVGSFIAKISRGRTIREFINGTMLTPMLYSFAWFNVFGAAGIQMERLASESGLRGRQSPAFLLSNGTVDTSMPCNGTRDGVGDYTCVYVSRLSERPHYEMLMDVLAQYSEMAPFIMPISLMAVALYFVTSSDSGSLVMDSLCANGIDDPPIPQKIYWAVTEGACATALLLCSRSDKVDTQRDLLNALEATAVISGLPYTILMCFMCASLWRGCQYELCYSSWSKEDFFLTDLSAIVDFSSPRVWGRRLRRVLVAVFVPSWFLLPALRYAKETKWQQRVFLTLITTFFYAWPLFLCLSIADVVRDIHIIGWWWYICFVVMLCSLRCHVRRSEGITGNIIEDVFACLLSYFLVVDQLDEHFTSQQQDKNSDERSTADESVFEEAALGIEDGVVADREAYRKNSMV